MKEYKKPAPGTLDRLDPIPIPGFSGYVVDKYNVVYSLRSHVPRVVRPWPNKKGSGSPQIRLTLFDDMGKRRQVSRSKAIANALGYNFANEAGLPPSDPQTLAIVEQYGREAFEYLESTIEERKAQDKADFEALLAKTRREANEYKDLGELY